MIYVDHGDYTNQTITAKSKTYKDAMSKKVTDTEEQLCRSFTSNTHCCYYTCQLPCQNYRVHLVRVVVCLAGARNDGEGSQRLQSVFAEGKQRRHRCTHGRDGVVRVRIQ